jgi:hypothetical protein
VIAGSPGDAQQLSQHQVVSADPGRDVTCSAERPEGRVPVRAARITRVQTPAMTTTLVRALQALVDGDTEAARLAVQSDTSLLGSALSQHLRREGHGSVYDQPAAFEAFIRGGGNIPLYSAVSAALADLYDEHRPATLLDVGCGDGMALLPALQAAQHRPARVDVVEPSEALLQAATSGLRRWQDSRQNGPAGQAPVVRTWPRTVQDFLTDPRWAGQGSWGLVESTFALHTLPHLERDAVLRAMHPQTGRLAVVEFDVPGAAVVLGQDLRAGSGGVRRAAGAGGAGVFDAGAGGAASPWRGPSYLRAAR